MSAMMAGRNAICISWARPSRAHTRPSIPSPVPGTTLHHRLSTRIFGSVAMEVQRDCMRAQIRRVLLKRIIDGTYQPGDRLKELQIAREFQSSQGPVREALRELEMLRLVESETYRGTRVRAISPEEMREAGEVRGVLEQEAA